MSELTPAILRRPIRTAALCLVAAALTACGAKGPPPAFYLLDSAAPTQLPGFERGITVGIGPIEAAPYLDRNQIVTRSSGTQLELSEQHQWAEPLRAGFGRVLLVNVGLELDSNRVFALPLRKRRPLDFQVPIEILRFDGVLDGEAVLGARWTLMSGDGDEILSTRVSVIREPVASPDYDAFVAAQSRAMAQLGREIAAAIQEQQSE